MGFWLQTVSAYFFGFNGWSLFFPQALAGVLSVALLYHLAAHVFGPGAGLLSALFLALTPIVIATDRTNEVDSMLMFVTLIATWALSKTAAQKPLKWLLIAFFLLGVGFNIKMMEAYIVLLAFYLFYVLSDKLSWRQKLAHLFYATVVLTGGNPSPAAAFVIFAGIFGAVLGPIILKIAKISDPFSRGLGMGTVSHGIGTSTAVMEGPIQGAVSSVAIGFAAIITSLILPWIYPIIHHLV